MRVCVYISLYTLTQNRCSFELLLHTWVYKTILLDAPSSRLTMQEVPGYFLQKYSTSNMHVIYLLEKK